MAEPPASYTLEGLLLAAALCAGRLSVLDFGGSLASHYLRWLPQFRCLPGVDWTVVEQAGFVREGERLFAGSSHPVRFLEAIPKAAAVPGAVLAGSSLQYLRDPISMLRELASLGARVFIVDRTPLASSDSNTVFVQHVPASVYRASYPVTAISETLFRRTLGESYRLLHEFETADMPVGRGKLAARAMGSIWLRKDIDAAVGDAYERHPSGASPMSGEA
jgi:putative methyltransferase (TIGR04325 family)